MSKKKRRGICENCEKNDGCRYTVRGKGIIICCAEYSYRFGKPFPSEPETVVAPGQDDAQCGEKKRTEIKGLCATCANFPSCSHSIDPAGVWHCEEYC